MDFWSFDTARNLLILRQFDSLGFVSTYVQDKAASRGGHIVVVSESLENVPKGWKSRHTFDFVGADEYREHFELDPDGKRFSDLRPRKISSGRIGRRTRAAVWHDHERVEPCPDQPDKTPMSIPLQQRRRLSRSERALRRPQV